LCIWNLFYSIDKLEGRPLIFAIIPNKKYYSKNTRLSFLSLINPTIPLYLLFHFFNNKNKTLVFLAQEITLWENEIVESF
jgi:hypothetical protein